MAIIWKTFQPVFRIFRHSFKSVIQNRGILTVARYYKRTSTQPTEQLGAEGPQMKETGHGGEHSNRTKLVLTGNICYYRPCWLQESERAV